MDIYQLDKIGKKGGGGGCVTFVRRRICSSRNIGWKEKKNVVI